MTWSTVLMVAVLALIGIISAVVVYVLVEAARAGAQKRRIEWMHVEREERNDKATQYRMHQQAQKES